MNSLKLPFHMATLHEGKLRRTQVLLGATGRADLIERVTDSIGIEQYRLTANYYTDDENAVNSTSTVTVGIGSNAFLLKQHD
jgi:hypothetical protein